MSTAPAPRPRVRTSIRIAACLTLAFLFFVCAGFAPPGIDLLFYLLAGWAWFLARVLPAVHVRLDLLASALAYAAALVVGSHYFLRWLHREMTKHAPTPSPAWRWRSTLAGFLILLLMFTAGMAAIGIAHQTAWLVRSPEPMFHNPRSKRIAQLRCNINLHDIGLAIQLYATDHDGHFPPDLPTLLTTTELSATRLICPSSNDSPAAGPTTRQFADAARTPHHCSYIYLGAGLTNDPTRPRQVLVYEPLDHHERQGINVLYTDFTTDWLDAPQAADFLGHVKPPTTNPTTAP